MTGTGRHLEPNSLCTIVCVSTEHAHKKYRKGQGVKPNAFPWELTAAAVFTIKWQKWAIAECDCALYVLRVFSAELKSVLPGSFQGVFFVCLCFLYPQFFSPPTFFFSVESWFHCHGNVHFHGQFPCLKNNLGGRCAHVENLLVVHFKQMGLESGFTCSSLLNVSYFMRHRIPDKRSCIGKEAMSRCFGLNMRNV